MNTISVLHTSHLKKHFGPVRAVEDVSLDIQQGEIFRLPGTKRSRKNDHYQYVARPDVCYLR